MKQIIFGVAIFVVATFFILERKEVPAQKPLPTVKVEEQRAVFISYIEYQEELLGKNAPEMKKKIEEMIQNMKKEKLNMLLLHVRPFSDAIYKSKIFPTSKTVVSKEGKELPLDILDYFIETAHKEKIEVHAWINPYRIRNTTDVQSISQKNPCYKWLGSDLVHVIEGKGIYYNPASLEVRNLVLSGVKELVDGYDLDGIHFDDYFYPNSTIDDQAYVTYQKEGGKLSRSEFRFDQTNQLVREVYKIVHQKKGMVFGISPEGNINNNYSSNFIDTKLWLKEKGYIDYIMPQIYFGFENGARPFTETLAMWDSIIQNKEIKLLPALAFYKVGVEDQYAMAGKREWIESGDIIARQIEESRKVSNYQGFSLFRYGSIFNKELETVQTLNEKENLFELIGH